MIRRVVLATRPGADEMDAGNFWRSRAGRALCNAAIVPPGVTYWAHEYWPARAVAWHVYPYPPRGERRALRRAEVYANPHIERVALALRQADRVLALGTEPVWLLTGGRSNLYRATYWPALDAWIETVPHPLNARLPPAERERLGRFLYEWITRE